MIIFQKISHFFILIPFLYITCEIGLGFLRKKNCDILNRKTVDLLISLNMGLIVGTSILGLLIAVLLAVGSLNQISIYVLMIGGAAYSIWARRVFSIAQDLFLRLFHINTKLLSMCDWILILVLGYVYYRQSVALLYTTLPLFEADSITNYNNIVKIYLSYGGLVESGSWIGTVGRNSLFLNFLGYSLHSFQLSLSWSVILVFSGITILITAFSECRVRLLTASLIAVVLINSNFFMDWYIIPIKFDGYSFTAILSVICLCIRAISHKQEINRAEIRSFFLLFGFVAGMSYNHIVIVALLSFWLMHYLKNYKKISYLVSLKIAIIYIALGSWPLYLVNFFFYGNPIYPFMSAVFGSGLGVDIPASSFAYQYLEEVRSYNVVNDMQDVIGLMRTVFVDGYNDKFQVSFDPHIFLILIIGLMLSVICIGKFIFFSNNQFKLRSQNDFMKTQLLCLSFVSLTAVLFWALNQSIVRYLSGTLPVLLVIIVLNVPFCIKITKIKKYFFLVIYMILLAAAFNGPRVFLVNEFHNVGNIRSLLAWIYSGTNMSTYKLSYSYPGNPPFLLGRAIYVIGSKLKDGDKVLSFINGNSLFPDKVTVFSGNGSLVLPSGHGLKMSIGNYESGINLKKALIDNGFCCVVINQRFLHLSEKERKIVGQFLSNENPDLVVEGTAIYFLKK